MMKWHVFFALSVLMTCGSSAEAAIDNKGTDCLEKEDRMIKHVILLGASIGRAWNVPSLPERVGNYAYVFEYVDGGAFDKSEKLKEILSRRQDRPAAVFLKECAAYFPGNFHRYKSLMERWIRECHEEGIMPIPTTVVPVTRIHSLKKIMIDIVKLRNPLKYGNPLKQRRNAAILEYNDWIRAFCQSNGLSCLDLEAAVRYSGRNRYLREDLAKVDGLHLNRKAYKILDQIVIPILEQANWQKRVE